MRKPQPDHVVVGIVSAHLAPPPQSADFRPRRDIWLHQTILLLIIFGKLCSSRMDHEMAHIFWSSCVTLGRRSAIFSQRPPATIEAPETLDAQWAAWIEEEVAKRVALIIFGVDVERE